MKAQLAIASLIMIVAVSSGPGYTADIPSLIEIKYNGTIDWTEAVVAARGIGHGTSKNYSPSSGRKPQNTLSKAITKARHNLLETIVGIRIDSQSRVIDIVENYPSIMAQLRGMTYGAPEVDRLRRYLSDGKVEVWSQLKLNGAFTQLILPADIKQIEPIKQVLPAKETTGAQTKSRTSEIYTGMVVDARGVQGVPVIAPRILDESQQEVFGPTFASREFAVQHGVTRYTTNIWKAKFHPRVLENPIIVKALKSIWPGRCDFIISNADAAKLRRASEHLQFLRECRVIIVLDPM